MSSRLIAPSLPTIEAFESIVKDAPDIQGDDGVLGYLASSLNRPPMQSHKLPAAVKAFYLGPQARQGNNQASETIGERPASPPKRSPSREAQLEQPSPTHSDIIHSEVTHGHRLRTDRASVRARAKTATAARLAPLSQSIDITLFRSTLIPPASLAPVNAAQNGRDEEEEELDVGAFSRFSSHASLGGASCTKSIPVREQSVSSKFASAIKEVMLKALAAESLRPNTDGIWPTGRARSSFRSSFSKVSSAKSFRSFRQRQSDNMKQFQQQSIPPVVMISLPSAPTQVLTSSLSKVDRSYEDKRSHMRKIIDLLKCFRGLDDQLKQALSEHFQGFEYEPGALLIKKGGKCREGHILLSGQAILYANEEGSGPSRRLMPGAVIGLDLMVSGMTESTGTVTTDLNFPSLVATISWDDYSAVTSKWASQQLVNLMPSLQLSMEIRFRKEIEERCKVIKKSPGESLFLQGQVADNVLILLQGSVLTSKTDEGTIQTESQLVGQLKNGLGPTRLSVPPDPPPPTRKSQPGSIAASFRKGGGLKFKTDDEGEEGGLVHAAGEKEGVDLANMGLTLAGGVSEGKKKRGGLKKPTEELAAESDTTAPISLIEPLSSIAMPDPCVVVEPEAVSTEDPPVAEEKAEASEDLTSPKTIDALDDQAVEQRPGSSLKSKIESGLSSSSLFHKGPSPVPPPPSGLRRLSSSYEQTPSELPLPPQTSKAPSQSISRAASISAAVPMADGHGKKASVHHDDADEIGSVFSRRSFAAHSEHRSVTGPGTSNAAETEASVPTEDIGSIPLFNALSTHFKIFKQALGPIFQQGGMVLGEEALEEIKVEEKFKPLVRSCTAIAVEHTSLISIPRQVLLHALGQTPSTTMLLQELRKNVAHEQLIKQGANGLSKEVNAPTKAERDEALRRYLRISPAARPSWQVEALADAFSMDFPHLFTKMPWQLRLRFFQEVQLKEILGVDEKIALSRSEMALEQRADLTSPLAEESPAPSRMDAPPPPSDHKDNSDFITTGPLQGWEAPLSDPSISHIKMQEDSKGQLAKREEVDQAYLDKFRGYDLDIPRGTAEPSSPRPVAEDHLPLKPPAPATMEPSLTNLPSRTKALPSPSKPKLSVKSHPNATLVPRSPHVSTDNSVYYVVTGGVGLQLFHSPISPHDDESKDEAEEGAKGSTVSKSLAVLRPGESFSSSTLDLFLNNEALTRLVLPASKDKVLWEHGAIQSFRATAAHVTSVTARTRRDTACSSLAAKAEVLHIPQPTLEMINSSGKPLSVDNMVDEAIFSNTFWSNLVSGEGPRSEKLIMARRFACFLTQRKEKEALPRVHEYKQGTELLRRGEAAACAFVVVKGECVLRGNYVGLLDTHAGSAAHTTDLGVLHAGQSAGELSLLADRPLWYSLIVKSSTATVVSLGLATLKLFFEAEEGDASRLLSLTAEEDRKLYAFAVQKQSMLIQAGKLDLSLFNGAMKSLLNNLMAMGHLNVSDILMHFASYVEADEGSGGSPKSLLHSYTPVVLDASKITHAITTIVGNVARTEAYSSVTNHDRNTLKEMAEHVAAQGVLMGDLSVGSTVERMGSLGGLRVAMPTPTVHDRSYQAATRLRKPLQVEKSSVPHNLKGGDIELLRFSAANRMGQSAGGPEMVLGLFDVESTLHGLNISVHVPTQVTNKETAKPTARPKPDRSSEDHFPRRPTWADDVGSDDEEEEQQDLIPDPTSPDRQKPSDFHSIVHIGDGRIEGTGPINFSPFLFEEQPTSEDQPIGNVSFASPDHPSDLVKSDRSSPGLTKIRSMTRSSPSFGRMASFSSRKIVQESPVLKVDDEEEDDDPLIRRLLQESAEMNRSRSASPRRSSYGGSIPSSVASINNHRPVPTFFPPLNSTPVPVAVHEPKVSIRELWVRGDVHDPSGLTSSHLGKLVIEAGKKLQGDQLPPVKVAQPAFVAAASNQVQSAAALARKMLNSKVNHPKLPTKRDPFHASDPLSQPQNADNDDGESSLSVESLMEKESMFITMSTTPKLDDLTGPDPLGLNKAARLRNESIQQQSYSLRHKEEEARARTTAVREKKTSQSQSQPWSQPKTKLKASEAFDVPAFHSTLGFVAGMEVEGGMIYYN